MNAFRFVIICTLILVIMCLTAWTCVGMSPTVDKSPQETLNGCVWTGGLCLAAVLIIRKWHKK